MDLLTVIQNMSNFVTSTLGIALILAALAVAITCKMIHMAHTWGPTIDTAAAGALLITLAATVHVIYG